MKLRDARLLRSKFAICVLLVTTVSVAPALGQESGGSPDPSLDDPAPAGTVSGTGTHFEALDSPYLNVTVDSSEVVEVTLESVPDTVTLDIAATDSASSTALTFSGFAPLTAYYLYEDDLSVGSSVITDVNGAFTLTQDLVEPHLLFILTRPSTLFVPPRDTDPQWWKDWWDGVDTLTLQGDVTETIQLESAGVTLDGAGYTVSGSGTGFGIYVRTQGATVENVRVEGFTTGIFNLGQDNVIRNNVVANNTTTGIEGRGVRAQIEYNTITGQIFGIFGRSSSNDSVVRGNLIDGNTSNGFRAHFVSGYLIEDNDISSNGQGVFFIGWGGFNTIQRNNIVSNDGRGVYLRQDQNDNIVHDNVISQNVTGVELNGVIGSITADRNVVTDNIISDNDSTMFPGNGQGIQLWNSKDNVIAGNTIARNPRAVLSGVSGFNHIYNNNFIDNAKLLQTNFGDCPSNNVYFLPLPVGGNFYSDAVGTDANSDGIFDQAYVNGCVLDEAAWVIQDGWVPGATWVGTDVAVAPEDEATGTAPVTVTYSSVTASGMTSLTVSGDGPSPPEGFRLGTPPLYYDISTTAAFEGTVTVCIDYSGTDVGNENNLALHHHDGTAWTDITTLLDTDADLICGETTSFSLFAVFERGLVVDIDIQPGSELNTINLGSFGVTPVAILGSAELDVSEIDPTSVVLASASVQLRGTGTAVTTTSDVNGDGYPDLTVHVETEALELTDGDTLAELEGFTVTGLPFSGTDTIRVVP